MAAALCQSTAALARGGLRLRAAQLARNPGGRQPTRSGDAARLRSRKRVREALLLAHLTTSAAMSTLRVLYRIASAGHLAVGRRGPDRCESQKARRRRSVAPLSSVTALGWAPGDLTQCRGAPALLSCQSTRGGIGPPSLMQSLGRPRVAVLVRFGPLARPHCPRRPTGRCQSEIQAEGAPTRTMSRSPLLRGTWWPQNRRRSQRCLHFLRRVQANLLGLHPYPVAA
jgi:hypothetical protein